MNDLNKLTQMKHFATDFQHEKNVRNEAITDDVKWLSYFDQEIEISELSWLLDVLYNGEYEFIAVRAINDKVARFEYKPWAWPYGGPEALQWLVQMFGFQIVKVVENGLELEIQTSSAD
jgi:hypothetical protein